MIRCVRMTIFIVCCGFLPLGKWPALMPGVFATNSKPIRQSFKTGPAADFPATVVVPTLDEPMTAGKNILWCSTLQLAWNEACDLLGEDIHLQNEPAMVASLDKKDASKNDLDAASYVALAGWGQDGILDRIRQELAHKFPDESAEEALPASVGPRDMLAYAFLLKNLEFPVPFGNLDAPLTFAGVPVDSFGTERGKADQESMYEQVLILNYVSADNFVIQLKTKSTEDQVILAKVQPGSTFQQTVTQVLDSIDAGIPEMMVSGDVLRVPKFDFKIIREYTELVGKPLALVNPPPGGSLIFTQVTQSIQFQMNENGVRLVSEVVILACAPVGTFSQHTMVFDQPFLILMKRAGAARPYFAIWVQNAELLAHQ